MINSTIAAIATPTGKGGIGIIRVSGPDALDAVLKNFVFFNKTVSPSAIDSHRVYYGHFVDANNNVIDEVLFIYMKSPYSYTTEETVEIQSHASAVVLRLILDILICNGVHLAEPGEFTKRAFLNGRIDLTQAEAVIDIINAKSKSSLDIALSQIQGDFADKLNDIKKSIIDLKKNIEAMIDFPDEVEETEAFYHLCSNLKQDVFLPLEALKHNFDNYNGYREGFKIVIVGPPNSGKSSLMNLLLNKDKSIVTNIPGTTRDLIEELISFDGIPCVLTDTAGLRTTSDYVETIGINKSYQQLGLAEMILIISDSSMPFNTDEIEIINTILSTYKQIKPILFLNNKRDIGCVNNQDYLDDAVEVIDISVKDKKGIDVLIQKIINALLKESPELSHSLVPNVRHQQLIKMILLRIHNILELMNDTMSYELMAIDINESLDLIDQILGNHYSVDILDEIFNDFCIGK